MKGDYIRYPALLELSSKYGLQTDVSDASLGQQLEDLREQIRREIRKELKIKGQFMLGPGPWPLPLAPPTGPSHWATTGRLKRLDKWRGVDAGIDCDWMRKLASLE